MAAARVATFTQSSFGESHDVADTQELARLEAELARSRRIVAAAGMHLMQVRPLRDIDAELQDDADEPTRQPVPQPALQPAAQPAAATCRRTGTAKALSTQDISVRKVHTKRIRRDSRF